MEIENKWNDIKIARSPKLCLKMQILVLNIFFSTT